ncbi:MAG: formyltransferase family protein [Anaerolineae bacterium]|nr:formyltransferase family protein [Anaerolineae bacterium]
MSNVPLRIITFNNLGPAFGLTQLWAEQTGNKIVLVVTTPGPTKRRTELYKDVLSQVKPEQDVLVTTRLRTVALPLIQSLKPDLIVSFSFPYLILPEMIQAARLGAVNLHPTPLPAYRGPNPLRMFYDGYSRVGATMHWTDAEFDTGRIICQHAAAMPSEITTATVGPLWRSLIGQTFFEGMARAIAGDPGTPQNHEQASYAAAFTEAEHWLDWHEPMQTLQRKVTALSMMGQSTAKAMIEGKAYTIARLEALPDHAPQSQIGTVLERNAAMMRIAVADGVVQISFVSG